MFRKKDKGPEVHRGPYAGEPQRIQVTNERSRAYGLQGTITDSGPTWVIAKIDGFHRPFRLGNNEYTIL